MSKKVKYALLSHKFGNGKLPIVICTLDNRPDLYIVRIDSRYKPAEGESEYCPSSVSDFMQDFDDDVWEALGEEFGDGEDCEECDSECQYCEFPAFKYGGCTYRVADEEDLKAVGL